MNITIVSSSPRAKSLSNRVALHLEHRLKSECHHQITLLDVRDWADVFEEGQPVYQSVEKCPDKFRPLAEIIYGTDAFVIVSPEYNGGVPYSLKRLFDHFTKQKQKPFAIATSSEGALGGMRAALSIQHYVVALFGILSPYMLITPHADKKFDEEGKLLDDKFKPAVDTFLKEFIWLVDKLGK